MSVRSDRPFRQQPEWDVMNVEAAVVADRMRMHDRRKAWHLASQKETSRFHSQPIGRFVSVGITTIRRGEKPEFTVCQIGLQESRECARTSAPPQ